MVILDHADTKFQRYLLRLTKGRREKFCKRIKTTDASLRVNFMRPNRRPSKTHYKDSRPCRSQPNSKRMLLIAKATNGHCVYEDMLDHFYRV